MRTTVLVVCLVMMTPALAAARWGIDRTTHSSANGPESNATDTSDAFEGVKALALSAVIRRGDLANKQTAAFLRERKPAALFQALAGAFHADRQDYSNRVLEAERMQFLDCNIFIHPELHFLMSAAAVRSAYDALHTPMSEDSWQGYEEARACFETETSVCPTALSEIVAETREKTVTFRQLEGANYREAEPFTSMNGVPPQDKWLGARVGIAALNIPQTHAALATWLGNQLQQFSASLGTEEISWLNSLLEHFYLCVVVWENNYNLCDTTKDVNQRTYTVLEKYKSVLNDLKIRYQATVDSVSWRLKREEHRTQRKTSPGILLPPIPWIEPLEVAPESVLLRLRLPDEREVSTEDLDKLIEDLRAIRALKLLRVLQERNGEWTDILTEISKSGGELVPGAMVVFEDFSKGCGKIARFNDDLFRLMLGNSMVCKGTRRAALENREAPAGVCGDFCGIGPAVVGNRRIIGELFEMRARKTPPIFVGV